MGVEWIARCSDRASLALTLPQAAGATLNDGHHIDASRSVKRLVDEATDDQVHRGFCLFHTSNEARLVVRIVSPPSATTVTASARQLPGTSFCTPAHLT